MAAPTIVGDAPLRIGLKKGTGKDQMDRARESIEPLVASLSPPFWRGLRFCLLLLCAPLAACAAPGQGPQSTQPQVNQSQDAPSLPNPYMGLDLSTPEPELSSFVRYDMGDAQLWADDLRAMEGALAYFDAGCRKLDGGASDEECAALFMEWKRRRVEEGEHIYLRMFLKPLARRARIGDKAALLELGIRFERGIGLPPDLDKAETLYRQAADESFGLGWERPPMEGNAKTGFRFQPISGGNKQEVLSRAKKRLAALEERQRQRASAPPPSPNPCLNAPSGEALLTKLNPQKQAKPWVLEGMYNMYDLSYSSAKFEFTEVIDEIIRQVEGCGGGGRSLFAYLNSLHDPDVRITYPSAVANYVVSCGQRPVPYPQSIGVPLLCREGVERLSAFILTTGWAAGTYDNDWKFGDGGDSKAESWAIKRSRERQAYRLISILQQNGFELKYVPIYGGSASMPPLDLSPEAHSLLCHRVSNICLYIEYFDRVRNDSERVRKNQSGNREYNSHLNGIRTIITFWPIEEGTQAQ